MTSGAVPAPLGANGGSSSSRAHRQLLDEQRDERRRAFRRPQRTVNTTRANGAGLGGRHLGVGISLSGGFFALFLMWRFAMQWDRYPNPLPTLAAWVILVLAIAVTGIFVNRLSSRMPTWMFLTVLATGEVVVGLDLAGYGRATLWAPTPLPPPGWAHCSPCWSPCGAAGRSSLPRWCSAP
ncbi:hypothetical protein [Cryobacterium sp. PAMC25264]|uniref:hypothetical protein n=1 Tax=Cryobacterium sp. PAMC25264 TaxID=2861288 RepID=UPI001C6350C8|nr:hypothetical protein [Cryobacterium sp. PAMC25264]QYF73911.1 hypothetical protein KY500_01180 [Cryobacterium sp. PAMC25264]